MIDKEVNAPTELQDELARLQRIGEGKTKLLPLDQEPAVQAALTALDTFNLQLIDYSLRSNTKLTRTILDEAARRFKPSHICIMFSGGKSSQVMLEIAHEWYMRLEYGKRKDLEFEVVLSNTGLEYPESLRFTRSYIKERFPGIELVELRPEISFFKLIELEGFPSKQNRWCCYPIKIRPSNVFLEQHAENPLILLGNHKTENSYRYNYFYWDFKNYKHAHGSFINPILNFDERELWRYITLKELKYNPVYRKACTYKDPWRHWHTIQLDRTGCWLCPLGHTKSSPKFLVLKAHYPKLFKLLCKICGIRIETAVPTLAEYTQLEIA